MTEAALPSDFLWGFATASYQIEGAITQDGRGPSIWDTFCSKPGKIADGSSGITACDSYNRTTEDIVLLKQTGAKAYRFSVAWSRVIPLGGRNDPINQAGLDYYIRLVDDLFAAGIEPMVTLFHWDLPDELDKRYGGLLNKDEFVADFVRYADVIFEALGSRGVKLWITFNEPHCSAVLGYHSGVFAPGRTSDRAKNPEGDSTTEPWIAGHNMIVAHGASVALFRAKYQENQGGKIGITLNGDWAEPYDPTSSADIAASSRRLEFFTAWFADPIYHGTYPSSMITQLGSRLPTFTASEIAQIKGSNDFYGMNHYTTAYIRSRPSSTPIPATDCDGNVDILPYNSRGEYIGPETQGSWLRPYAPGFRRFLGWIKDRYGNPQIYVTENGTSIKGENDLSRDEILDDQFRVKYFEDYIGAMVQAVKEDGVDVRGYMAWSLLDNFEWADGYATRFGCTYVDYANGQKRYPKKSALELAKIFERYMAN